MRENIGRYVWQIGDIEPLFEPISLMDPTLHTALSEHPTIDSYISYLIEEDYHFRTNGQQVVVLGSSKSGHWGHAGRPGKRGGSVPRSGISSSVSLAERMVNKETEAEVDKLVDYRFEQIGGDPAEVWEKRAMDNFRAGLEAGEIAIMISPGILGKVAEEGQFKNQHETGFSRGLFDPEFRAEAEQNAFNIPDGAAPASYPIYGFVDIPGIDVPVQYGFAKVILRDGVKDRATVTLRDSMDGFDTKEISGTPYRNPRKASLDGETTRAIDARKPSDLVPPGSYGHQMNYVEVQIHGGVSVGDIAKIVNVGGGLLARQSLERVADALGVPYEEE